MPSDQRYQKFYTDISTDYEASRYGSSYGQLFRELHYRQLAQLLNSLPATARVVEVACGTGHATRLLGRLQLDAYSFDLTDAMISKARASVDVPQRERFARADAFRLPLATGSQQALLSTRFMHLFTPDAQTRLVTEFLRVLAPGGLLILDFDNLSARRLFGPAIVLYNLIRYRRWQPDTHYDSFARVRAMIEAAGAKVERIEGVGGIHLAMLSKLSSTLALRAGGWHRHRPFSLFAEQFIVCARKT